MNLDEVYLFLKSTSGVSTHAAFSTDYLGHSPRYFDYLRCSGARPSLHAMLKLALRLTDMAREEADELEDTAAGRLAKRVMSYALNRCR